MVAIFHVFLSREVTDSIKKRFRHWQSDAEVIIEFKIMLFILPLFAQSNKDIKGLLYKKSLLKIRKMCKFSNLAPRKLVPQKLVTVKISSLKGSQGAPLNDSFFL